MCVISGISIGQNLCQFSKNLFFRPLISSVYLAHCLNDVLYLKFRSKKGRFTWSNKKVVRIDIESNW